MYTNTEIKMFKLYSADIYSAAVVEEIFIFFTEIKAPIPKCKNTPLQIKKNTTYPKACRYYHQNDTIVLLILKQCVSSLLLL